VNNPEDAFESDEYQWYDEAGEPAPKGSSRHAGVYFLYDPQENALKVGTACNINQRLCTLEVGNPRDLTFIGWIPGGLEEERKVHQSMPEQRIRGEWYRMTPEILAMVRSVCAANRVRCEQMRAEWRLKLARFAESPDRPPTDIEVARGVASTWPIDRALAQSLKMAQVARVNVRQRKVL
jgi:hypothetical protein